MSSFIRFVIKTYKNSDTAYGDIARDMLIDETIKRTWSYRRFLLHLNTNHKPCDRVLQLLEELNDIYCRKQQRLYQ